MRLASCAGFRADVLPAIARHGATTELGDEVPFSTGFGSADRSLVALVVAAARRRRAVHPLTIDEIFTSDAALDASAVAITVLRPIAVDALAAIDDLALSGLWREVSTSLGDREPLPSALGQSIRELVVQCRAAVANGWEVFVVEDRRTEARSRLPGSADGPRGA